ncbi:MAG: chromosomal replication initiator protein DnaA [Chloroflexi bacterium]|nr:chromosomal replication initiator protein DnaA [Chloroflexota bacterium]
MKPEDAWLATLGQLQLQLHRSTYDTWLRDSKFLSYEDKTFTIRVRNGYTKDWLEQKLYRAIRHTMCSVFREQVEIKFVVQTRPQRELGDGSFDTAYDPDAQSGGWSAYRASEEARQYSSIYVNEPPPANDWNPQLNSAYTFENFVVGPSNQMAQAAAYAVSVNPGQVYNPLYIYGNSGLGKTHLLQAIGNACFQRGLKVLYATSEQFMNGLVEAIRGKTTSDFRDYYRGVDVLLIDDVQFMAGKDSTQEEFFHTFNALREQGKQVVIASDRRPQAIKGLDDRLRSRFEWGLQVEILTPSYETRLAILNDKSEMKGHALPHEIAHLIASYTYASIRDLEGTLTQILAYKTLMGNHLTIETTERILAEKRGDMAIPNALPRHDVMAIKRQISLNDVLQATARFYQLSLDDILSKRRTKDVSYIRQLAIYLAREETQASWPEIGDAFGGRNHSTMVHGYKKVAEEMETNLDMRREIEDLRKHIHQAAV